MKVLTVHSNDAGQRLDKFLTKSMPNLPQSMLYKAIRTKRIKRNGKRAQISDRLQEGDILVTKFTDTGWTPKFAILSGIVTEYGGILCHAAIVSREYGIPAIVACKDAMSKIRDGQIVTIDGSTGTVTIKE